MTRSAASAFSSHSSSNASQGSYSRCDASNSDFFKMTKCLRSTSEDIIVLTNEALINCTVWVLWGLRPSLADEYTELEIAL